jgi:multiple sugar transport system substrate-binding protein
MSFSNSYARVTRLGLTLAGVCLAIAPLSGCGGVTPTAEPVTIAFAHPDVDTDYYEPLVRAFNESTPHITVEPQPRPADQVGNLDVDDTDVFAVGVFTLIGLQQQGEVLSLDPFIEQDASLDLADFYPGMVGIVSSEGKTWAVPAGVDIRVMYYSQDLFDQHGVPYPETEWTWDDFLSRALDVADPDAGIYGYTTTPGYADAALFVLQHGGQVVDDMQNPTRTTFDDPSTIAALEWFARLFHEYDVAPTLREARKAFGGGGQYAFYDGLRHGQVGMWMGMLSERGGRTWPVEWFVNWGMAPLPHDEQSAADAWVEGYAISSQTEHPDACWQWILFLSEQMPDRLMPPRRSLAESTAYEQQVGQEVAATARASLEGALLVSPWTWSALGQAMDIFERAVDRIINGDISAREAMDWAQREAESRMGQGE